MKSRLSIGKLCFGIIILINSFLTDRVLSQEPGTIAGKIIDAELWQPVPEAWVVLQHTRQNIRQYTLTSSEGTFIFSKIPAGEYLLVILKDDYYPYYLIWNQKVYENTVATIDIYINSNLPQVIYYIGQIEVTALRDLWPEDHVSVIKITSGEIENMQATNLGDVLEAVPGLEKTRPPGLREPVEASIRGEASDFLSPLGTSIIVDEVPISNISNMQYLVISQNILSTAGRGLDLRLIPADNLAYVEVIKGVPSVRYGDFTEGIIKVTTKTKNMPPRLKLKNSPDTREANWGGGFALGATDISYNLNYGYSERNRRKIGDEYHRLIGSVILKRKFLQDKLTLNYKLLGRRKIDEEKPTDVARRKSYDRGYTVNSAIWGTMKYSPFNQLKFNTYLHHIHANSYKERFVDDIVPGYTGGVRLLGDEWQFGGRVEQKRMFFVASKVFSQFLWGTDFRVVDNVGQGEIIDSTKNYYGPDSPRRSYSFEAIDMYPQLGFYIEGKATARIIKEFTFTVGFRYDLFQPRRLNWGGLFNSSPFVDSRHGTFLSPRIGLIVKLTQNTRLRLATGSAAKAPPFRWIYPPPQFFLIKNKVVRHDQFNLNLKGYQEHKYEVAFDKKVLDIMGMSLELYYTYRKDEITRQDYPFYYQNGSETITSDTCYTTYENLGWTKRQGIDASLWIKQVKNISLVMNVSYRYEKGGINGLIYDQRNKQWVLPVRAWLRKLIFDYKLQYQARSLGAWVSLFVKHVAVEKCQNRNKTITNNIVYEYPNRWIFGVRTSKSLFKGAEVSLYIYNLFDDRAVYHNFYDNIYQERNPPIYYGFEFSTTL